MANQPKRALLSGISGQDGSYLSELLLSKGYEVYGLIRRTSTPNTGRIAHIIDRINMINGDMTDHGSIDTAVQVSRPDEVYNLAAMSDVRLSYDMPTLTMQVNTCGYAALLESVRKHKPDAKVYQASSSEMFGKVQETPQTERTPFYPRSPYGVSKAASFYLGRTYREGYGLHVTNGILFNHESNRRGANFLSKKVVAAAVRIFKLKQDKLVLGNLDARRDWGSAKDYVFWMWKMLQQDKADDWLIATGETHTVREFVEETFGLLGMDWRKYVEFSPSLTRPAEVDLLLGDPRKARAELGYKPKLTFKQLVQWMVDAEMGVPSQYEDQWEA